MEAPSPKPRSIVIVGGYGAFGARVAERLARHNDLDLVIAGRNEAKARTAAEALRATAKATVSFAALDAMAPDVAALIALHAAVVVNASGPFQAQNYALAEAAVAAGSHYVDLADARTFVTGITCLDAAAKQAGVLVTSGASSVPAIAAAIVDAELPRFERLEFIHHGITPGNGYDPGAATSASILGGLGKPMPVKIDGSWTTVRGWLGLWRYDFPGLGKRFMTACDIPDIELFPARYPSARTVRFSAGLEVAPFQLALWTLAQAVRLGLLSRPEKLTSILMSLKHTFRFLGSDAGGMFVILRGTGADGTPLERRVHVLATTNQGPYIPAIASIVLARRLARAERVQPGARPCLGLVTLEDFTSEVADLPITVTSSTV